MNPPFGTRKAGIDTIFVKKAMDNANVVYSLHKTTTRDVNQIHHRLSLFNLYSLVEISAFRSHVHTRELPYGSFSRDEIRLTQDTQTP